MIIKNVRLSPFGGISDREIILEKGLNVIFGPNEAGKSTIYSGIQRALFTPSKLSKKAFEQEMKNYIPVGGGDTVKVEMQLVHNEKLYILKKTWGGSKVSELHLPDGSLISEETAVNEKLGNLLAAGSGTYKWVLMTYQSGLAKTLEDLGRNPETIHSLGEIIRKTLFETDGVSVEKFKVDIEELYGKYFEHWDCSQNFPEKNRGIENPFTRGVGKIIAAFYIKETLHSRLEKTLTYEEAVDRINKSLEAYELEIAEKDKYVKENRKSVDDAQKRKIKFLDLQLNEARITEFSRDNYDWVTSEYEIKKLIKTLPLDEEVLGKLEKQKMIAEKKAENEVMFKKFERVEKCKKEMNTAKEAVKVLKKIDDEELKNLISAFNEVDKLKASIEAGKLRARFETRKTFLLTIQKDFEEEYSNEVGSGETFLFEAGGKLRLEHPDWKLEVSSGEKEIENIIQSYEAAEKANEGLLIQYGVRSIEEADTLNKIYNDSLRALKSASENLNKELGDTTYEELVQQIEGVSSTTSSEEVTMPLVKIAEEHARLQRVIAESKKDLNIHTTRINELTTKYGSQEKLFLELGKTASYKDQLENEIKDLFSLPDGLKDDETFIEYYKGIEKDIGAKIEKKYDLLKERLDLEKEAPDESSEELKNQQKEAETEFQNVLRKGKAIARIRDLTQIILAEMDSCTYEGLKTDLEQYVSFMTNGKHMSVKMENGNNFPCGFVRNDGAILDYELLSTGTKDVFSLALRLSMAKYFLKEASGFLIMDDPFVDMDPERQQKAGEIIRKFAKDKQVVIFTCHPTHAKILEGNQIHL